MLFNNYKAEDSAKERYEDSFVSILNETDDPVSHLENLEINTEAIPMESDFARIESLEPYRFNLADGVKNLEGCTEECLQEAAEEGKENPLSINGYILSEQAMEDLIMIAGINCPATRKIGLEERIRWLHQGLGVRKKIVMTAIFRDQKIRAMVTPSYVPLRQSIVYKTTKTEVLDKIPGTEFVGGYIDHRKTEFNFESIDGAKDYKDFLESNGYTCTEAKIAMTLSNSDTGEGAVSFTIGLLTDDAYIPFEPNVKFRMPHKGNASYDVWKEKLSGIADYVDTSLANLEATANEKVAYGDTCYANCINEIGAEGGNATWLATYGSPSGKRETRYDIIHNLSAAVNYVSCMHGMTVENEMKFMAGIARLTSPDFNWSKVDIPIVR